MKYSFRGQVVFEYIPNKGVVAKYARDSLGEQLDIIAFNHCSFIIDDYRLLSKFFETVHKHMNGENVELADIEVF
jgi:hypothetical protein